MQLSRNNYLLTFTNIQNEIQRVSIILQSKDMSRISIRPYFALNKNCVLDNYICYSHALIMHIYQCDTNACMPSVWYHAHTLLRGVSHDRPCAAGLLYIADHGSIDHLLIKSPNKYIGLDTRLHTLYPYLVVHKHYLTWWQLWGFK